MRNQKDTKLIEVSYRCDVCGREARFAGPEQQVAEQAWLDGWRIIGNLAQFWRKQEQDICSTACLDVRIAEYVTFIYPASADVAAAAS